MPLARMFPKTPMFEWRSRQPPRSCPFYPNATAFANEKPGIHPGARPGRDSTARPPSSPNAKRPGRRGDVRAVSVYQSMTFGRFYPSAIRCPPPPMTGYSRRPYSPAMGHASSVPLPPTSGCEGDARHSSVWHRGSRDHRRPRRGVPPARPPPWRRGRPRTVPTARPLDSVRLGIARRSARRRRTRVPHRSTKRRPHRDRIAAHRMGRCWLASASYPLASVSAPLCSWPP